MSDMPPDPSAPQMPPSPPPPASPPPSSVPPIDYDGLPRPFDWADFLTFRTMIAVPVIMVLFWVAVVWTVISGIVLIFHHAICYGLAVIVFGPFVVRLQCEFLIVVFRMNETLTEVHNTLRAANDLKRG